jgi:acid phosphatase (class A)
MKFKVSFVIVCFLFLSSQATALADWSKVASKDFTVENYPAEGSPENKADYDELLALQRNRSEKDCALATKQKYPDFKIFFGDSGLLAADEIETVLPLLNRVAKLSERVTDYFKHQFERPRPYDADKRIHPCAVKPTGSLSYPSAHASSAALDACVLAELFPNRAKKIVEYGSYLGDLRAISGVHHPSDVAAGKQLGKDICEYLLGDESFQADLKEVNQGL